MQYWLFKSEPTTFSIDHLMKRPKQTEHWDGVRNFQARNFLRKQIKKGDQAFFYHSSCNPPGIAGVMEIVRDGYPDFTAWDCESPHYDPKSSPERPLWYMVDVKFVEKFENYLVLDALKANPKLSELIILRRGNRLSITPVTPSEWREICKMGRRKA